MIGIDFETNGVVPPGRHEVVEIAAANYASGSVFHSLVNPGSRARWSKGAEETHKIAQEDVMNPDVWKWNAVWDAFLTWLKREAADRRVMLIAHNGFSFDFRILLHKSPDLIDPNWTFFDTLKYARYLRKRGFLEKSLKQEVLMEYFNLPSYGPSSTICDGALELWCRGCASCGFRHCELGKNLSRTAQVGRRRDAAAGQ